MNRNFMIGFMYDGYFYCANVHRYPNSWQEYHITILANRMNEGVPSSLIIKDDDAGLRQLSNDPVPSSLLNTILAEIQRHGKAN